MLTAIIDYESGNLHSAHKAFERMAREHDAGEVTVTSDAEVVARADRLVLPGDGAFPACMAALKGAGGLYDAMVEAVEEKGRPFLGICVGMQLMASMGREYEDTPGLGWIGGEVTQITPKDPKLKVPHMGWNDLVIDHDHPVFEGLQTGDHTYFVHSYHMAVANPAERLAHVEYGGKVTAIIGRDTMLGMQFHPEKSQTTGLRLISNFLTWAP
ncbi:MULTISPECIES: imidazole glycerol phosphate synthase subunit HisH [Sulfitobacter]|uniref:imidazole glycerol phosphate synthase subunit HisH n=1 Tax=Sulfitobacter TaxID=60136 RepID=UPI0023081078|nr:MULTISPECIES: imidazole glycerol phosphate synthase subunit HisH [Sulfitobacter]MDF3383097.1 imidazole glycerol phosphate synthase subunit HisH [Sulfitobacter sp. Ks11]MDF3386516.1 imidazole glycerol phosphate synthase subunit HisH [Sulfitobacter sp. M85]MDF3389935.1 imidazole glycerol phosphate synthase subunit HisH [Sulfitobacter sp. Ks16]MDF3400572.1 imidazole glycerol phosphate synthase subunit HisH [Sulfitobacter sp. KE39]MDF3403993.1 imidazole glycerol phosphate synthase subunit HisH 